MRSSPDKFCDGRTDGQTDRRRRSDPYMSPLLRRGDTKTSYMLFQYLTVWEKNNFYQVRYQKLSACCVSSLVDVGLSRPQILALVDCSLHGSYHIPSPTIIEKYGIPKEGTKQKKWKCYRVGLIEPVHGQYWKVSRLKHWISSIQHLTWHGKIWNFEISSYVFILRLSWNLQCDI
jgi:hypothetical protein